MKIRAYGSKALQINLRGVSTKLNKQFGFILVYRKITSLEIFKQLFNSYSVRQPPCTSTLMISYTCPNPNPNPIPSFLNVRTY